MSKIHLIETDEGKISERNREYRIVPSARAYWAWTICGRAIVNRDTTDDEHHVTCKNCLHAIRKEKRITDDRQMQSL